MKEPLPVVAFDLDDTLYPEREYTHSALLAAGHYLDRAFGTAGVGPRAIYHFENALSEAKPLDAALAERGLMWDEPLRSDVLHHMHDHSPAIRPFDDTMEVLLALRGIARLAVITEGRTRTQMAKLKALSITHLLDEVVITEALGKGITKASGYPFAVLRERLGGHSFVYVGDNPPKDRTPAEQHGYRTIIVRRPDCRYIHDVNPNVCTSADLRNALSVIKEQIEHWARLAR